MIEISTFYQDKSNTERKLEALKQVVACEQCLKTESFHLTGGVCIGAAKLNTMMSSIELAPELSDRFFKAVMKAVEDHRVALVELNKQVTNERED